MPAPIASAEQQCRRRPLQAAARVLPQHPGRRRRWRWDRRRTPPMACAPPRPLVPAASRRAASLSPAVRMSLRRASGRLDCIKVRAHTDHGRNLAASWWSTCGEHWAPARSMASSTALHGRSAPTWARRAAVSAPRTPTRARSFSPCSKTALRSSSSGFGCQVCTQNGNILGE